MTSPSHGRSGNRRPADVPRPRRCVHLDTDPRGYPIIATVTRDGSNANFGSVSELRKLVLATFDLCAVCGHPFHDELRWQVSFSDQPLNEGVRVTFSEAPVHEVCALYAAQVCPFVSSPYARLGDEYRRGTRRPESVILAGYTHTQKVFGARSGLQQSEFVLHFEMDDLQRSHTLHDSADAAATYAEALRSEPAVVNTNEEQHLVDLVCSLTPDHHEDSGGVMAGAAWYLGAAFCPKIRKVQGMDRYADRPSYNKIARQFILDPRAAAGFATETRDPATQVAMAWFTSRRQLPALLEAWRRTALKRLSNEPAKPSRQSQRQKRRSQTTARRKNRK